MQWSTKCKCLYSRTLKTNKYKLPAWPSQRQTGPRGMLPHVTILDAFLPSGSAPGKQLTFVVPFVSVAARWCKIEHFASGKVWPLHLILDLEIRVTVTTALRNLQYTHTVVHKAMHATSCYHKGDGQTNFASKGHWNFGLGECTIHPQTQTLVPRPVHQVLSMVCSGQVSSPRSLEK